MLIHGKERKFRLTVGVSQELAKLCPGNDLRRMGELFGGEYIATMDVIMEIIILLNRGDEEARSYEEPGHAADPITIAELRTLTQRELKQLQEEALSSFRADSQPTVEAEPDKDAKKKASETP